MALNKRPTFINRPGLAITTLDDDMTPGNFVSAFQAGAQGAKVVSVLAQGEETAARELILSLWDDAEQQECIISTIEVPAMAGREPATPAADFFTTALRATLPKDADGQPYILLGPNQELYITQGPDGITSDEVMGIAVMYGDFATEE